MDNIIILVNNVKKESEMNVQECEQNLRKVLNVRENAILRRGRELLEAQEIYVTDVALRDALCGGLIEGMWKGRKKDFLARRSMLAGARKVLPFLVPTFSINSLKPKEFMEKASYFIEEALEDVKRKKEQIKQ